MDYFHEQYFQFLSYATNQGIKKKRFTCHCASAIAFQFESTGALNALILCVGISKVETKQKQSYVKIRQETKEKTIFLLNENHEISRNFD